MPDPTPDKYWPKEIMVSVTAWNGARAAFVVTREEFEDNLVVQRFNDGLAQLRRFAFQSDLNAPGDLCDG